MATTTHRARGTKKMTAPVPKQTRLRKSVPEVQPAAVYVDPKTLRAWKENPRRITEADVDKVAASIKRYGFGAPLVARLKDGELIAGHVRHRAALKLGLAQVPVRYLDLSAEDAHQLALADNRLHAAWDESALLEQLRGFAPDTQQLLGWSGEDIAKIERTLASAGGEEGKPVEDEPPRLPKVPITKPGDVWVLGRHRLICGDCRDPEVLGRLLEGGRIRPGLMVTDPPYGVSAKTGTRDPRHAAYGKGEERDRRIENDTLRGDLLEGFLRAAFEQFAAVLSPGAAWYVWYPGANPRPFLAAVDAIGGLRHPIMWRKPHWALGRADYHYQHEQCLYGWTDGGKRTWLGGRDQSTTWDVALDKAVGENIHPSIKPVELYVRPVRNHLGVDGSIFDPFAGTGPAISAAEQLGRAAQLVEIDPRYCDVIVGRWETLSGERAVRVQPGAAAHKSKKRKTAA
jgi:site-specific DNA-methyltransferase (adenine-specific)